jgi:sensor histidine kinase YesM
MKRPIIILLNIGYWVLYLLLLVLILACLQVGVHTKPQFSLFNWRFGIFFIVFAVVPAVMGFYFSYSIFFARYLTRKKIGVFFIATISAALLAGITGATMLIFLYRMRIGPGISNDGIVSAIPITLIMAFIALLNGVVGLVMKGFVTWYGDIKLKEDLGKKNYEIELALVKSQINPHFLFNTINNIDVLIEKDAVKASAYLNKLSDMMRFMLYETKTEKIPLQKEISYIKKYIELQQIRVANPNHVSFMVTGDTANTMIHPMLFIPFIENAFKHNSDIKSDHAITIAFTISSNSIIFTCRNTCSMNTDIHNSHSGLGNELIQKRLTLLYGVSHELKINHQPNNYSMALTIHLHDD